MGLNIVVAGGAGVRGFARKYLSRLGHQVRAVATERELAEECRIDPPDAVVCDSQLPDADGVMAALALREQGIPVVVVAQWRDRGRVWEFGLTFVPLPLTPLALIAAVAACPPTAGPVSAAVAAGTTA